MTERAILHSASAVSDAAAVWSSIFAGLTFLVAAIAAVVALVQLRAYFRDQWERGRPFVVFDFAFRSVLLTVELRNTSAVPATDLQVRTVPAFQSTPAGRAEVANEAFKRTIAQLTPGRSIRYFIDRAPDYYGDKDLPRSYDVTVSYADGRTRRTYKTLWRRAETVRYEQTFTLDIEQWSQALAETDYANKNWNAFDRMDKSLRDIKSAVKTIAERD